MTDFVEISKSLREVIVHPITKNELSDEELEKSKRSLLYYDFVPAEKSISAIAGVRLFSLWKSVQSVGEISYQTDGAVGNFSHNEYGPSIVLGEELRDSCGGWFLDIGCGLLGKPVYMEKAEEVCTFVGIDPAGIGNVRLYEKREFDFLRAIGDFLPFRNETFDGVVFSSTLDHHISPQDALKEAYRVLKPGGEIYIVETIRKIDPTYIKWLIKVRIFGAAIYNKFHCWAFTEKSIKRHVENAGFLILSTRFLDETEYFIKAKKI